MDANPQDFLETCPVADDAEWQKHAVAFAQAFVVPTKQEPWEELLTRLPRQILKDSHKLYGALNRTRCQVVATLPAIW